jgi:hypothetical protein
MRSLVAVLLVMTIGGSAQAQRVVLELRPRFGDTVWIQLEQSTEMSIVRAGVTGAPTLTTLSMYSRAIVESSTAAYAMIRAITDSVAVSTTSKSVAASAAETERQLEGRQMRLKLQPDGTVNVADSEAGVSKQVGELVSLMPASFPRGSVTIGDTWLREMPLPPDGATGVPLVVRAAIRLDSISTDYDVAYLSMRGNVVDADTAGPHRTPTGRVTGSMVVDRRRGWLSASRFTITLRTLVPGPEAGMPPSQVLIRVIQQMRVIDKR